jgi:hypothetical protein
LRFGNPGKKPKPFLEGATLKSLSAYWFAKA